MAKPRTPASMMKRIAQLESENEELHDTLRAIRSGEVDALVIDGPGGDFVFTLNGAEQPYRELVEAMNEGAATMTEDGLLLYCNGKFAEMAGLRLEQAIGSSAFDLFSGEQPKELHELLLKARSSPASTELRMKSANKTVKLVQLSLSEVKSTDGRAFCAVVTDLTDRLLAEVNLQQVNESLELRVGERTAELSSALARVKENENELQSLANSIPQLAWMADASGSIFWYNQGWYDYTGSDLPSMAGWGWIKVHHPDHVEQVAERWMESVRAGTPFEMTFPLKARNGEFRSHLTRVNPLRDSNGKILRWFGTNTDVEDVVRANQETQRAREELYSFFMQAPAPMVILNGPEHTFQLANPLYEKYVGRKVLGKKLREVFSKEEVEYYTPILDQVYLSGEPYVGKDLPLVLKNEDGEDSHLHINVSYTPFRNSEGAVSGILAFIQDVTEEFNGRMNMESHNRQLQTSKDEAEKANELKTAFLANMSHEIRTPLGAMIGFADLLGQPGLEPVERANYIDILHRNGEQLGRVINDILDLSKVETGHVNFEHMKVSPLQVAHEVVSLMAVLAREKGVALSFEDDGTTPAEIVTDPTRMKQVLMNLVSNALKFTKVGTIKITLSGFEGKNGAKCCAFEVADTGAGIPEALTGRLFKMFTQADNSMTRKFGGTGLGLALSRSLARAMGGDVRLVRSVVDRGSTFHFSVESREDLLPSIESNNKLIAQRVQKPLEPNALKDVRVLLVEDSPDNQQLIWRYLSNFGALIDIADNGLEGMQRALAGSHDIVLMDLQMPIMDGYTAVGKLRSKGYSKPIVALTAHAMSDVKKKCRDVGCTDHLPKPINPRDLIEVIARLTGSHQA